MKSNLVNPGLLYSCAIVMGLSFWAAAPFDPDLGWHLFGGSFIARYGEIPRTDLINTFSPHWHDYHWLAQICMFGIWRAFGYEGLSLVLGLLMGWFAKILVDIARISDRSLRYPTSILLSLCFALTLLTQVTSVRPQVLALLALALALRQLLKAPKLFEFPFIFILAVLTANIHVYWIFIPALWFYYRVLPRFFGAPPISFLYGLTGFLLLLTAALFSPYGIFSPPRTYIWSNYALLFEYAVMPEAIRSRIAELQGGLTLGGVIPYLVIFFAVIAVKYFPKGNRIRSVPDQVNAWSSFILAIRASKFLAVFALFSFRSLVHSLRGLSRDFSRKHPQIAPYIGQTTLALLFIAATIRAGYYFPWSARVDQQINSIMPVEACQLIARLPLQPTHGRSHIRILTHFNYGGWCRWIIAQENPKLDARVTTDGRTQWVPEEELEQSFDLYNVKNAWLGTLQGWSPDVLLIPKDRPLFQVIARLRDQWTSAFEDENFAVFVPTAR